MALLRGVNVGGRGRVPMAELRTLLAGLGLGEVRTYIQSGNALFTSREHDRATLARTLEQAVDETFGVPARVVLRTFAELAAVVGVHPFGDNTSRSYVAFLAEAPSAEGLARLAELDVAPDRFEVVGSEVFLQYADGVQGARLTGAQLERRLGVAATARNWRTVLRLVELAGSS